MLKGNGLATSLMQVVLYKCYTYFVIIPGLRWTKCDVFIHITYTYNFTKNDEKYGSFFIYESVYHLMQELRNLTGLLGIAHFEKKKKTKQNKTKKKKH